MNAGIPFGYFCPDSCVKACYFIMSFDPNIFQAVHIFPHLDSQLSFFRV